MQKEITGQYTLFDTIELPHVKLKSKRPRDPDQNDKYDKVCRIIGAHNVSTEDRQTEDYYATDPIAAEWLMQIEKLDHNIWECACGGGHLAKAFSDKGYNVRSTDLIYRNYGTGGVNFLECTEPYNGDIITNPPYRYAEEFIKHGLELIPDGNKVCMLLKVQFLEGKARQKMFKKFPPKTVWVSSSRIKHGINGNFTKANSMMAIAWYVWEKGYKGDTVIKWFN